MSCSIDPARAQAKMDLGEMISTKEAKIRTILGYCLLAANAYLNFSAVDGSTATSKHSALGCVLGASGILLCQMGRDSQ